MPCLEDTVSVYLSRLILNANHARTKSEVDHPYELHRTICKGFDDPTIQMNAAPTAPLMTSRPNTTGIENRRGEEIVFIQRPMG